MQVIIGVDIGTSGTKAIAFTSNGTVIANAYEAYNPVTNMHGYHELDPDLLLKATITCMQ
jgi:gluconokinase